MREPVDDDDGLLLVPRIELGIDPGFPAATVLDGGRKSDGCSYQTPLITTPWPESMSDSCRLEHDWFGERIQQIGFKDDPALLSLDD